MEGGMSEEGFLDAIRNEPDNNAHRPIYADWLEENDRGQLGQLIRQEALLWERLQKNPWNETLKCLHKTYEHAAYVATRPAPTPPATDCRASILCALPGDYPPSNNIEWRRGQPYKVDVDAQVLNPNQQHQINPNQQHLMELLRMPSVRHVNICNLTDENAQAAAEALNGLPNVNEISLVDGSSATAIFLQYLKKKNLSLTFGPRTPIDQSVIAALTTHMENFPGLRALDISNVSDTIPRGSWDAMDAAYRQKDANKRWKLEQVTCSSAHPNAFVQMLAASPMADALRTLHINNCDALAPETLQAISSSEHLKKLETLMFMPHLTLDPLLNSTHLPNLKHLNFRGNEFSVTLNAETVSKSPVLKQLESLNLGGMDNASMEMLLKALDAPNLHTLALYTAGNRKGDALAGMLRRHPRVRQLRVAYHAEDDINTLFSPENAGVLEQLRHLWLYHYHLTWRPLDPETLTGCEHLSGLETLFFRGGDAAALRTAFSENTQMRNLRGLELECSSTTQGSSEQGLSEQDLPEIIRNNATPPLININNIAYANAPDLCSKAERIIPPEAQDAATIVETPTQRARMETLERWLQVLEHTREMPEARIPLFEQLSPKEQADIARGFVGAELLRRREKPSGNQER